jgi:hypothetical protein
VQDNAFIMNVEQEFFCPASNLGNRPVCALVPGGTLNPAGAVENDSVRGVQADSAIVIDVSRKSMIRGSAAH